MYVVLTFVLVRYQRPDKCLRQWGGTRTGANGPFS